MTSPNPELSSTPATLEERFGQTMRHAGVAVSITTFTDVIAFFIGSNTVLPGLQSFCIYAAVAIFAIYVLQITHFVAWFSLGKDLSLDVFVCIVNHASILDVKRQAAHRDGCLCCFVHKHFKSYEFSKGSWLNKAFGFIGSLIVKRGVQILILIATTIFLSGGIWGTSLLQQVNYRCEIIPFHHDHL